MAGGIEFRGAQERWKVDRVDEGISRVEPGQKKGENANDPLQKERRLVAAIAFASSIKILGRKDKDDETPGLKSKKLLRILWEQAKSAGTKEEFMERWALLRAEEVGGVFFRYFKAGKEFVHHLHRYTFVEAPTGALFIGADAPQIMVQSEGTPESQRFDLYDMLINLELSQL